MIEFLLARQNLPFTISIGIMVFIALIEGLGALIGFGVSDAVHSLFPNLDFDMDVDVDSPDVDGPHLDAQSGFTKLLGWLRIGKVPMMALLILFLTSFGLIGLIAQTVAKNMTGALMSGGISSAIAFGGTLPVVRVLGRAIGRIMPQDETEAVSEESFVGKTATIVIGKAASGKPAQAKLKDQHGTTHYIMVEPDVAGEEFTQGKSVLIVSKGGAVYKVIRDTISPVCEAE